MSNIITTYRLCVEIIISSLDGMHCIKANHDIRLPNFWYSEEGMSLPSLASTYTIMLLILQYLTPKSHELPINIYIYQKKIISIFNHTKINWETNDILLSLFKYGKISDVMI
jgi:hypothetical protein